MSYCLPPESGFPAALRFRILETVYDDEASPIEQFLPVSIEFIEQGFEEITDFYNTSASGYSETTNTSSKTLELKEVFVPVRIAWKHYTQDKDTLVTTSTDESTVLDVDTPSHTWPLGTPTDPGVTNGEWDGDWKLQELV